MNCAGKILTRDSLTSWRHQLRAAGRRLAVTYLEAARNQADVLLVGVNSDSAVRNLKGPGRPVNSEEDRALVIAALESVDSVFIFRERDAVNFLQAVQPDIYVKGGDYTLDTINQDERRLVEGMGGKIVLLAHVPGKSTTAILKKLAT